MSGSKPDTRQPVWLRWAAAVDRLSERLGALVGWLTLGMVLIGAFNAIARYVGRFIGHNLSSNLFIELQWYLFSVVFLLGASYALRRSAHVRVDVLYGRLSRRARAWIDILGTVLFLLPFCITGIFLSWPTVRNSWAVREVSPDPGGLARYPIKTLILVAFALLVLQGLAELVKHIETLRAPVDPPPSMTSDDTKSDETKSDDAVLRMTEGDDSP
ncbi:MAG: TRAP transporter small permease subunit [Acidobacteriota bacterium]